MFLAIAAAVAMHTAPAASSPDIRIQAHYDEATGQYCLRLTNPDATMPSGLGLNRRLCRTLAGWAREGVVIERRQLASR